jgi:parallel beta-helix repeat protein
MLAATLDMRASARGYEPGRETLTSRRLRGALIILLGLSALGGWTPANGRAADRRRRPWRPSTFYVASWGSNRNRGTSSRRPWRTIWRVERASLRGGDSVLFAGGETFDGAPLQLSDSGSARNPITIGSFGAGEATITRGAYFVASHLRLVRLRFRATVFGGTKVASSNDDSLIDDTIVLPRGNDSLGLYVNGRGWLIEGSTISDTGLSGMLIQGSHETIRDNTVNDTGLDSRSPFNNHGIYLDASDTTITGNTISNFADSGISVRYHGNLIAGNAISHGEIGIDFYQTDPDRGTSVWVSNTIRQTSIAGIFVSPAGAAGQTRENFEILDNVIHPHAGVDLNLHPTTGFYIVGRNRCRGRCLVMWH